MFVLWNFKNINWEHVKFDEGKSQFLPFLVVYHILSETETWPFLSLSYGFFPAWIIQRCNVSYIGIRRVQINSERKNWIGCYYRPNKYVYGASFTGEYLRDRTRSNKLKPRCTLFHVVTYAIHVEQTLTQVTRTSLAARNSTIRNQSIHRLCMYVHPWIVHLRHTRLSVCDLVRWSKWSVWISSSAVST